VRLVVGCPLRERDWIVHKWFEAVDASCEAAGVDHDYVVVGNRMDQSVRTLARMCAGRGRDLTVLDTEEEDEYAEHRWDSRSRLERMASLRNELLSEVRQSAPDYFLSLDSDILVKGGTVSSLLEDIADERGFAAVSPKAYMAPGTGFPNYMLRRGGWSRRDADGFFQVDVIMAAKLMSPEAYAVDYRYHHIGEDVGWSLACAEAWLRLGWDGRLLTKHVMRREALLRADRRVGF
jgi:hypothetical protein